MTALTTFSDLMSDVRALVMNDEADEEYANAVCTYLALAISKNADYCSRFVSWGAGTAGENVRNVFTRQAIPMVWDFAEANPFANSTGSLNGQIEWAAKVVERLPANTNTGQAYQADAATTIHAEGGPVIVTDPPYYDNISYAQLSDFFYVWLRPLLRDTYPDLFAGILVPIQEEMIAAPRFENARDRFEDLLNKTLRRIRARCSPEFPSSIFYAYKQQEEKRQGRMSTGWETMLSALVSAGFRIVGTWPMRTEFSARSNALKTNALASSVVLVCRPRPADARAATRRQFYDALEREMPAALDHLTREGHIAPTDLAQAAIGPGMEIYSRYSRVATVSGKPVPMREALTAINKAISDYDQKQEGDLDSASRFCLEWLKEHGYDQGAYGQAEDLARAKNVAVAAMSELLTAERGAVQLLPLEAYQGDRDTDYSSLPSISTAWEGCMRMVYHLEYEDGGYINGAADVARAMYGNVNSVERLARLLYNHYDRAGDSDNAVIFNTLVTEWPRIMDRMHQPDRARLF